MVRSGRAERTTRRGRRRRSAGRSRPGRCRRPRHLRRPARQEPRHAGRGRAGRRDRQACYAGTPIKLTATPGGVYRRPPRLGEHTAEILAEFGMSNDRSERTSVTRPRPPACAAPSSRTPASSEKMMAKAAASATPTWCSSTSRTRWRPQAKERGARPGASPRCTSSTWGARRARCASTVPDTPWAYADTHQTVVEGAGDAPRRHHRAQGEGAARRLVRRTLLTSSRRKLGLRPPHRHRGPDRGGRGARLRRGASPRCCPRLEALILGVGDLSASQGMKLGHIGDTDERYPGDIWHYARAPDGRRGARRRHRRHRRTLRQLPQPRRLRREAARAAALGCVGKWAIHPSQIELANDVFAPTEEEIANARQVVDAVAGRRGRRARGAARPRRDHDRRGDRPDLPGASSTGRSRWAGSVSRAASTMERDVLDSIR